MKKKNQHIALLLATLLFSSFAFGCSCNGCKKESAKDSSEEGNREIITPTDDYVLQNAKSDYKIVYPKDVTTEEMLAVTDLQTLFEEATTCRLPAITDDKIAQIAETDKYIVIGENKFSQAVDIDLDTAKYGRSGYVIQTVGSSIYVTGAEVTGTLLGTYKFLQYILDYDYYFQGVYELDKGVANIQLMNYDVSFVPDIQFQNVGYEGSLTPTDSAHYKYGTVPFKTASSLNGHASMKWLPVDKYLNPEKPNSYHSKWYMSEDAPTQLCYSSHGDPTEYDLMTSAAAQTLIDYMQEDRNAYAFDCSITDKRDWCGCDGCNSITRKYGAPAALVVRFLNDVTEKVDAWLATEEGKPFYREYYVEFYAYYGLVPAPVTYDSATGEFSTVDDSVFCNKRVVPVFADVNMDYLSSVHDTVNFESWLAMKGWSYLSDNFSAYFYAGRYNDYMAPLESFNDMQTLYQFCKEIGALSVYTLGIGGELGFPMGWCALRIYLGAKLGQNVDIDFEGYIQKFFKGVYKDGAKPMKKLFDEWRLLDEYNQQTYSDYAGKTSHYNNIKKDTYYSASTLLRWRGYIDEALSAIEPMKNEDKELYDITYKLITAEAVWVDYFYYSIYRNTMPSSDLAAVKKRLLNNMVYLGVSHMQESPSTTTEAFLEELRG